MFRPIYVYRSKHVTPLIQNLLSKYGRVLTDTCSVYYIFITHEDVPYKMCRDMHPLTICFRDMNPYLAQISLCLC